MVHDLLVTVGIYSIFGFQVTPDTVDRRSSRSSATRSTTRSSSSTVSATTRGVLQRGRLTYGEMVNLSMNQTLARSINTSLVAILPVLSVLLVGAEILGATTLQSYGLALFVGLLLGAYSSIFIASPLLAMDEGARAVVSMRSWPSARRVRAPATRIYSPAGRRGCCRRATSTAARAGDEPRPPRARARPSVARHPSQATRAQA